LEETDVDGKISKWILSNRVGRRGLDSSDSRQGPVEGSCEHGNLSLGSMKDGEFLYKMSFSRRTLLHEVSTGLAVQIMKFTVTKFHSSDASCLKSKYKGTRLVTVAVWSEAWSWPVGFWDRGFESRSRHGCLSAYFCVVLSCVGRGLATG
jgi:hypothetical protein